MKFFNNILLYIICITSLITASNVSANEYFSEALKPIDKFDWSEVMEVPENYHSHPRGDQILHFKSTNKPFTNNRETKLFVEKNFISAKTFFSDADVLRYASSVANVPNGFYLEMGVATGRTINFLAALNPTKIIYGFDSFEGLPKQWNRKDKNMRSGTFAFKDKAFIPHLLHNVSVYKGWFKDTLPKFKKHILKNHPIAVLHIDSDIYESAKEVLHIFKDNIVSGTIIVFDEYYNYPGYENHEIKAFKEFIAKKDLEFEYIAYNQFHEQVAVRIK